MDGYSPDNFESFNNIEQPKSNNSMMIIIILLCVCICFICMSVIGYFAMKSNSSSVLSPFIAPSPASTSAQTSALSAAASSSESAKIQVSGSVEKKSKDVTIPSIPGVGKFVDDKSLTATQLDCAIKLKEKSTTYTYTCAHPDTYKIIKLINGPVLKISSSNEIDAFNLKTTDFYIIVPFVFIVDFLVSVSLKEIEFKSLQDFIKEIERVDQTYQNTNTIPDKCLKVPVKTRAESKAPYNTTCIFFPGFSSIGALVGTLQKTIVKEIPIKILTEYYNSIDKKLEAKEPELTVFEYVMYVASMNRVKSTKYRYFGTCDSDQSITC